MAKKDIPDELKKCAATGKTLRKATRYYRDGKYYYSQSVYRAKKKKDAAEASAEKTQE